MAAEAGPPRGQDGEMWAAIMAGQNAAETTPAAVGEGTPTMTVCRRGEISVALQEAAPTAARVGLLPEQGGGTWMAIMATQDATETSPEAVGEGTPSATVLQERGDLYGRPGGG
jgi:hypothetical protein